jgi:ABC-type antimicrobial peptide transport system permease subunit
LIIILTLLAHIVSQRTREIGIRVAMGAGKSTILRMVLSDGLWPAIAGIAAGLAVFIAAGRIMDALLYDVTSRDPGTYITVPVVLLIIAVFPSILPAYRATRIDPVETLRAD